MKKHNFKTRNWAVLSLPLMVATLAGCGATQSTSPSAHSDPPSVGAPSPGNPPLLGSGAGNESTARFGAPQGVGVDSAGNVYVADTDNKEIREISPEGWVITISDADRGLEFVDSVVADKDDNLYVGNLDAVVMIPPDLSVNVFAGSETSAGSADGNGQNARFAVVDGMAFDSQGNLFVVDSGNNKIRKITPSADVTTFAGSGQRGSADGAGASAQFNVPYSLAVDSKGNVFVADCGNNEIRMITPDGVVTTIAGSTTHGSADGLGKSAGFYCPAGIAVDSNDNVYVADRYNNEIRKITSDGWEGVVSTLAGSTTKGSADGTGAAASFNEPFGLAITPSGNLFVADTYNNEIREVSPAGVVVTIAGSTAPGHSDGSANPFLPDPPAQ